MLFRKEKSMAKECNHKYIEFRIKNREGTEYWPVRECIHCRHREVLSENGYVEDDWDNWNLDVEQIE
jgi:hypothetical protein